MKARVLKKIDNAYLLQPEKNINLEIGEIVEIKKKRNSRTLDQNALYWLFCEFCSINLYMIAEEIHEGFKEQHLRVIKKRKGIDFFTTKSTTDLSIKEFTDYFEKCNMTAIEFGVDVSFFWSEYEQYKKF